VQVSGRPYGRQKKNVSWSENFRQACNAGTIVVKVNGNTIRKLGKKTNGDPRKPKPSRPWVIEKTTLYRPLGRGSAERDTTNYPYGPLEGGQGKRRGKGGFKDLAGRKVYQEGKNRHSSPRLGSLAVAERAWGHGKKKGTNLVEGGKKFGEEE